MKPRFLRKPKVTMDRRLGYLTVFNASIIWPLTDKWYCLLGCELFITGRTEPSDFGTPWIVFMIKFRSLASSLVKGPNICERECHFIKILDKPLKVSGVAGGFRGKSAKSSLYSELSRTPMSIPSRKDCTKELTKPGLNHCLSSCSQGLVSYFLMSELWKSRTGRFCSLCFQFVNFYSKISQINLILYSVNRHIHIHTNEWRKTKN